MPVAPHFTVDTRGLFRDLRAFQEHSKKDIGDNLAMAGRGIMREVVAVTPPNHIAGQGDGEKVGGADARKLGEAAIMGDLYKIFFPATAGFMRKFLHANPDGSRASDAKGKSGHGTVVKVLTLETMRAYHRGRKNSAGRVGGKATGASLRQARAEQLKANPSGAELSGLDFAIVRKEDFTAYAKMIMDRVGWMGHGWGPGASRLNVSLPAYVSRHPASHGTIAMALGPDKFFISATNNVAYASNPAGYTRRVQYAVNKQAEKLRNRVQFFLEKRGKETLGK